MLKFWLNSNIVDFVCNLVAQLLFFYYTEFFVIMLRCVHVLRFFHYQKYHFSIFGISVFICFSHAQ